MEYTERFTMRTDEINGGDYLWIDCDQGAWAGPHREYKPLEEMWLKYTPGRNVVVQAGGCCGMYPRLLKKQFDFVYTFEPDPMNFHCLVNNCQDDSIFKINAALGEKCGRCELVRSAMSNVGQHTIKASPYHEIPMFTIDSLDLSTCNLIQLDVEGHEEYVLKGALETIKRCSPTISMENGWRPELKAILEPLGYKEMGRVVSDTIWAKET